jgi:two-component system, OmpR family, response regulator VicR
MKALIVEDDPLVTEIVSLAFIMRWPDTTIIRTKTGKEAISLVEREKPDLVILDLGLPDQNGFDVLKSIRIFSIVPIIILTARDDDNDIIMGLEWGADDYITKPFKQLELMSRAQAILRRSHMEPRSYPSYGSVRFGNSLRALYVGSKKIVLTSTESAIMYELVKNGGITLSTSNLCKAIWGGEDVTSFEAIRVYIRRLRKKIEANPEKPALIITHPGSGYSLEKTK